MPNAVRMMIPESIVKQHFAYAEESNFKPLSRRTLLNSLSVVPCPFASHYRGSIMSVLKGHKPLMTSIMSQSD